MSGISGWRLFAFVTGCLLSACDHIAAAQTDAELERRGAAGNSTSFSEIPTDELLRLRNDDQCVLVDTRDSSAYNGWRLDGVSRGGHLQGAANFSASWLDVKREGKGELLQAALDEKRIVPGKKVVLCDTSKNRSQKVAAFLQSRGFAELYLYDLRLWSDDGKLPLYKYPNYRLLVPPTVVKQLIDGERPETFERARAVKIAEVSWGDESKSYAAGHVPGSFHINTDSVEPPPDWMLGSDEHLEAFALAHGFVQSDTVILSSDDPMAACRVAVILRYIGVSDVRVLNGGLSAWKAADLELELQRPDPVSSTEFGAKIPVRPELIDTHREVQLGLENPTRFTLVDNRSWEEHIGEISGYSYYFKKGRIPGAKFGHAGKTGSSSLDFYRNSDGWIGWSRDPANPVESGLPPGSPPKTEPR